MPNDNFKYEKKEYWESRYASEESYDWCKRYADIKHLMEHGIQRSDRILMLGNYMFSIQFHQFNILSEFIYVLLNLT